MNDKVNLLEKLGTFDALWTPKIVAELNGQHVKLARVKGAFVWHRHEDEDELFMVVRGRLKIELEDDVVVLDEGELFVVPSGVRHRPVAEEETWILMFEPASTRNTGDVVNERTVERLERI